jgi:uncharacterized membrane protein YkoI
MKPHVIIAALLLLGAAAPAVAGQDQPRGGEAGAVRQVPLSRVLGMLAQRHPGKQLNTTMGDAGGRPAYLVQWQLANGRIVVFVVDAETGQELGQQGG